MRLRPGQPHGERFSGWRYFHKRAATGFSAARRQDVQRNALLLCLSLIRLPVYCLRDTIAFAGAGIRPEWWKDLPLLMEAFPRYGGSISPAIVEGFPPVLWKDFRNGGEISRANVEGFPRYGGRISPLMPAFDAESPSAKDNPGRPGEFVTFFVSDS